MRFRHPPPAEEATALSAPYQEFLLTNGGRDLPDTGKVPVAVSAELLGSAELVFSRGKVVGGIHAPPNAEAAEQMGALLYKKISEATSWPIRRMPRGSSPALAPRAAKAGAAIAATGGLSVIT